MNISNIKIIPIYPKNGLVAFASFTLNENIFLSSIGIHEKKYKNEYRLTYPEKNGNTLFHPISKELSLEIEKAVFAQLKNVISKNSNDRHNSSQYPTREL